MPTIGLTNIFPPGGAYTTGLSHNPFTLLLLQDREEIITPKLVLFKGEVHPISTHS